MIDGDRLSDVLSGLGRSMADAAFNRAISPVTDALGGALGGLISGVLPFENGGVFSGGRVAAFARGGVVDGPTRFPMRGGVGLMGEAGPEAIMPLARGSDGKLGVRGGGSSVVNVTMSISTPDVAGFQRSRTQISAGITRAIQRGQRNL
ncbi:MAG: phage tail tape measure protein [Rhodobacteraceae bacterium]|nr:phage tail tape measure protein [Paracoccaceae bacterium]